ncbi:MULTISPECIES: phage tail protein [Erwinia]|uniref:Tail protein n=1 Tax=Erwinia rhapontici TaxID=55212 RepID=A0ABN6DQP1_ERWRD|nr:phage tail protein [Erwinia rhapontici]BCQ36692.1 tail protein [Erwinia rhapontici]BCQ47003.1 tail protein [Erwinia rhapontici]
MLKPNQLREALLARVPQLKDHPERLTIALEQGVVACTPAASLSFEYQYPLRITLSESGGDIDPLVVALLLWLRENQPDLMTTPARRENGMVFSSTTNGDFTVVILLTERVLVSEDDGALHVTHVPEPLPPEAVSRPWKLYINQQLVSEWPAI